MKTHISSLEEYQTIIKDFSEILKPADRIGLTGPLGAGKTTFAEILLKELGVRDFMGSPTFTLRHAYDIDHPVFSKIIHLDLYRLENNAKEAWDELGLADDWNDPKTLILIEWPERIPELTSNLSKKIHITWKQDSSEREIEIEG